VASRATRRVADYDKAAGQHAVANDSAFYDEFAVQFFDDNSSSDEERFLLLGMSTGARLLLVCHCEREAGNTIRIISARKATKRESTFYGGEKP